MNLYFLLEGEKTELLLYPQWINYILPNYSQVEFENEAQENNFYLFSCGGIPSIYNHTINAIKNINDNPIYDKLIVCLDGEELGTEERIQEIEEYIKESDVELTETCKIHFVVQNICIETWFLGNRKIVKKIPEGLKLREFLNFYNVVESDPEAMEVMDNYKNKAHFHISYFKEILKEHNLIYKKNKPDIVIERTFFDQLELRINETNHLQSFKYLIQLLYDIRDL